VRAYLRAYLESMTELRLEEDGYPQLVEGYRERDLLLLGTRGKPTLGRGAPLWSRSVVGRLQLGVFAREGEARIVSTGDPCRDAFREYAHRFRVFVPAAWVRSAEDERMVRRAVDAEKPAHTAYDLCLVEPRFRLGVQSTVGLDTIVAATPVARLACRADRCDTECPHASEHEREHGERYEPAPSLPPSHRLGYDTVLACRADGGSRLGTGLRVGLDATLT
jgi:hypothetical protein